MTLLSRFSQTEEARYYAIEQISVFIDRNYDTRQIEIAANPDANRALLTHVQHVWSEYGKAEPYWSVLANDFYRMKTMTEAKIDHFYASGLDEVEHLNEVVARNGLNLPASITVAELGCGVGRMSEHFATRYQKYIGIDISAGHLEFARRRAGQRGVKNARYELIDRFLAEPSAFDLFYSILVLQHNPPPIMIFLLDAFLGKLNAGGFAYFQVPCQLFGYRFRVADYLAAGQWSDMEMHALPQRHVFSLFQKHGLQPIETTLCGRIGSIGASYAFLAKKAG
jgi:SAM-dependent methyltransferase